MDVTGPGASLALALAPAPELLHHIDGGARLLKDFPLVKGTAIPSVEGVMVAEDPHHAMCTVLLARAHVPVPVRQFDVDLVRGLHLPEDVRQAIPEEVSAVADPGVILLGLAALAQGLYPGLARVQCRIPAIHVTVEAAAVPDLTAGKEEVGAVMISEIAGLDHQRSAACPFLFRLYAYLNYGSRIAWPLYSKNSCIQVECEWYIR